MCKLRTIAMYLPQFHEIEENNTWWGKGYTDWTAVKAATPLFSGHNQPREPLNNDYYNLMERKTMERQAELAKQYELDGFCFYHYYFKHGKKILEKPAENLLEWKDINMPFCFCWANQTWARTWSNIPSKNVWADNFENISKNEEKNGILLEQRYGREAEWKNHFEYLVPFFKDERYIKYLGKPVFLIYNPEEINSLAEMIKYWNKLAEEKEMKGIYVIGLNMLQEKNGVDAILFHAPAMYRNIKIFGKEVEKPRINGVLSCDYKELWENGIKLGRFPNSKTYYGAFTDYDDTPRRGKNGSFLREASLELYEKYLYKIMKKNRALGNEFQFINAFNEWGEGMYLEPDKKNGYSYLEITQRLKNKVNNEVDFDEFGNIPIFVQETKEIEKHEKYRIYMNLLDIWMNLREKNIRISKFLEKYEYKKVAIYGYGIFGKHLLTELKEDNVDVRYIIDRRNNISDDEIKVCNIEEHLQNIDVIIITPILDYEEIYKTIIKNNMDVSIISLKEIIDYLSPLV